MQNDFWMKAQGIQTLLAAPIHEGPICYEAIRIDPRMHADLSHGYCLEVCGKFVVELAESIADFKSFLTTSLRLANHPAGYRIVISKGTPDGCPPDSAECFEVSTGATQCEIVAPDGASARRALIFLEDQMSSLRFPALPLGRQTRWTTIGDRITRSPIAAYRFKTGWELPDEHDYYPEAYLNRLAHCGINGIWVAGLFRTLVRTQVLPELGPASNRLAKLTTLVEKAARYGIKVHLFCMEPRPVSPAHAVIRAHPEIRGATVSVDEVCLCTSAPQVQEYLKQAVCELFKQVPELGGLITIFNGERITNCWLEEQYAATCPRCSKRTQVDVLAEDLNCFAEGIRRAGSPAKVQAWNYWMTDDLQTHSVSPLLELIGKTDREIIWLSNFEHGGTKTLAGREIPIDEYSLSFTGPGKPFAQVARRCRDTGSTLYAKLQVATTFELPTVPYIPVPGIVFDKIAGMKAHNATGTMLNWIPGGFPSLMLKAAAEASFTSKSKQAFLSDLARIYWPADCAGQVVEAWNCFEKSLQEYPFNNRFFYYGPITRAPAYPLRLQCNPNPAYPFNWGIDRHRKPQPFEETFERWILPLSVEEILNQLERMIGHWKEGLDSLHSAAKKCGSEESRRQLAVAFAVGGHFQCTKNVIEFLLKRSQLSAVSEDARRKIIERMATILQSQIAAASEFPSYIAAEPTIGFHSEILDFSYDIARINSAIEVNRQTLAQLAGGDAAILDEVRKQVAMVSVDTSVGILDVDGD